VLLLHRNGTEWVRLDLTTGALDPITLPDVDLFNAEAMPGGIVVAEGEEVRYYDVLGEDPAPEGVVIGSGNQAVRAGPDRLWLFDQPGGGPEVFTNARLVDLQGTVLREVEVAGYQTWATPSEVLVSRAGRVYVVEGTGYRPIATGWINGIVGDRVLMTTCDDRGDCAMQLQPTDGGAPVALVQIEDPDNVYYDVASAAPDGRVAVIAQTPIGTEQRVLLFDREGAAITEVAVPARVEGRAPQWLPDDHGLVLSAANGLQWVHRRGDKWLVDDLEVALPDGPRTFFVITP
jgi:hypothetical protein